MHIQKQTSYFARLYHAGERTIGVDGVRSEPCSVTPSTQRTSAVDRSAVCLGGFPSARDLELERLAQAGQQVGEALLFISTRKRNGKNLF